MSGEYRTLDALPKCCPSCVYGGNCRLRPFVVGDTCEDWREPQERLAPEPEREVEHDGQ